MFYIGIGSENRAFSKKGRNNIWKRIVAKHGFEVAVTHTNLIWEEACSIEKYLISFYGKMGEGGILCNMTDGGEGALGRKTSNETKNKIRNSLLGRNHSEEAKKKMSESRNGKPSNFKGKSFSEESKRKISNSKKGCVSPRKGVKLSEESKLKMSESRKGRKPSPKAIEAVRKYWLGRKHTEESKNKMSLIRTGEKRTPGAIINIINAHIKYRYTIQTPSGSLVEVSNIRDFCLENGLDRGLLYKTHGGKTPGLGNDLFHKKYRIINKVKL